MKIAFFAIVKEEEELIGQMLDCVVRLGDLVEVCSLVDNGSCDDTLDIIESYRSRLPIVLQHERSHSHHGWLRNLALEPCRGKAPWILYMDADETWTTDMRDWLLTGECERADIWDFFKISLVGDKYHTMTGGNGPCTRMFRNVEDVHFTQNVHTYPDGTGLHRKATCDTVCFFEHTALKSREALWAKGWRYQVHQGTIGIGPPSEYIGRVDNALAHPEWWVEIPDHLWPLIP